MFLRSTAVGDSQTLRTSSKVVSLREMHLYHPSLIGTVVKLDTNIEPHTATSTLYELTHLLTFVV